MTRNQMRRLVLDNGLRVLLAPNPTGASIGVAVHYGVGFRTEPKGHTGLAHLFEHLMIQGGHGSAPGGYLPQVQRAGGLGDAKTRQDLTVYYAALPPPRWKCCSLLKRTECVHRVLPSRICAHKRGD